MVAGPSVKLLGFLLSEQRNSFEIHRSLHVLRLGGISGGLRKIVHDVSPCIGLGGLRSIWPLNKQQSRTIDGDQSPRWIDPFASGTNVRDITLCLLKKQPLPYPSLCIGTLHAPCLPRTQVAADRSLDQINQSRQ